MKKLKLEINDRVEVRVDETNYKSRIQSLTTDAIFIDIPLLNNEYLMFNTGDEIKVITYGKEATVYELSCTVEGRSIDGNIRLYKLSKPHKIKKIQRRGHVRVQITRIIKCLKKDSVYEAILLDLSGGGMRIKTSKDLVLGDEIGAIIVYEDVELRVIGKVVRIIDSDDRKFNTIGVEFINITESERDTVVKIVFKIMAKNRKLM